MSDWNSRMESWAKRWFGTPLPKLETKHLSVIREQREAWQGIVRNLGQQQEIARENLNRFRKIELALEIKAFGPKTVKGPAEHEKLKRRKEYIAQIEAMSPEQLTREIARLKGKEAGK